MDEIDGPAADLLWLAVNNLPFYIAIEPLLSFLKDTFCDAGLGSTASKSDLIDGDHEEGTLSGSSKGKEPIHDIREGTLQPCSSKGEGAHLRQHGAHPGSVLFPRERPHL